MTERKNRRSTMPFFTGSICLLVMYGPAVILWLVVGRYVGFDIGAGIGMAYVGYCFVGLLIAAIDRDLPAGELPRWMLFWPRLRKNSG